MTFGFWKVGKGIREQKYVPHREKGFEACANKWMDSELAREKMWSRIHLIPLLTAEEDRDLVRRHYADQAREKELLGSNTSPYNSDRYVYLSVWNGRTDVGGGLYGQLSQLRRVRNRNRRLV
jgi:hypothetical protein